MSQRLFEPDSVTQSEEQHDKSPSDSGNNGNAALPLEHSFSAATINSEDNVEEDLRDLTSSFRRNDATSPAFPYVSHLLDSSLTQSVSEIVNPIMTSLNQNSVPEKAACEIKASAHLSETGISHANLVDFHAKDDFFRIEHWYPYLQEHTFPTTWFSLPLAQARALTKYASIQTLLLQTADQLKREKNPLHLGGIENWDDSDYEGVAEDVRGMLTPTQIEALDALKANIQVSLDSLFADDEKVEYESSKSIPSITGQEHTATNSTNIVVPKSAFIRLSTRSPKDSALTSSFTKRILMSLIAESKHDRDSVEAQTEDIVFFTRALGHALQIRCADDAMSLLFRSQRTFGDIMNAELFLGGEEFEMNIILRRWVDIYPEWEFRAFVYDNQITACSQYNSHCYVPEMALNKMKIQDLILSKWEEVKSDIPRASYTIDFVLDSQLKDVWVVEVNHLPPVAGTAMFDWDVKADRAIIENGPFELRIRDELDVTAINSIHQPLRRTIDAARGRPVPPIQVSCDQCGSRPILFPFYHCTTCTNFDVCQVCISKGLVHSLNHQMMMIESTSTFTPIALTHDIPAKSSFQSRSRCEMM